MENLFLSVGAMKAGTTWLFSQLSSHADIFFAREKEIHYFAHLHTNDKPLSREARLRKFKEFANSVNEKGNIDIARRLLSWYGNYLGEPINDLWYMNLFCYRNRQKYCADFSNLYALLPDEGWEHVHRLARNLRVIYTMRDPLERLWSHTRFQMFFVGRLDELQQWRSLEFEQFLRQPFIEPHSRYAEVITRLRRNLTTQELRVYFFESFRGRPLDMLRDVETFLDVKQQPFGQGTLDRPVAKGPEMDMPAEFVTACRPIIDREYEALAKLGMEIPSQWTAR